MTSGTTSRRPASSPAARRPALRTRPTTAAPVQHRFTLSRLLVALYFGFRTLCPACHRGRMFPSRFKHTMHDRCPRCGLVFEPDLGEVTGGMAINMVLTSILGTAAAIYFALFTRANIAVVAVGLTLGFLAFGLWFHQHARGLWVGFLYATGALFVK